MQEPVGTGDTGVVEMVLPGMTENCKATFGLAIFFTKNAEETENEERKNDQMDQGKQKNDQNQGKQNDVMFFCVCANRACD